MSKVRALAGETDTAAIRDEELLGRDYLVVPVVALVETVVQGLTESGPAETPEYVPKAELEKTAAAWNLRPVVMNHPKNDAGNVTLANLSPEMLGTHLGFLAGFQMDGAKLRGEMWLDKARISELNGDAETTLARLQEGRRVEVSCGYLTDVVPMVGTFEGMDYGAVQTNLVPDHLALLSEGDVGACSFNAGCGAPRTNACGCAKCQDKKGDTVTDPAKETPSFFQRALAFFAGETNRDRLRTELRSAEADPGLRVAIGLAEGHLAALEMSDQDLRVALRSALEKERPGEFFYVLAVFAERHSFVYEQGWGSTFLERSYTDNGDGQVTLGDETAEVRPVTEFVAAETAKPAAIAAQEDPMDRAKRIDSLIGRKAFTDDDKTWLSGLTDEAFQRVESMAPTAPAAGAAPTPTPEPAKATPDTGAAATTPAATPAPVTTEAVMAALPADQREVLQEAVALRQATHSALVASLRGHARCPFSEEVLKGKTLGELRDLARLAGLDQPPADFSGVPLPVRGNETEDDFVNPPDPYEHVRPKVATA